MATLDNGITWGYTIAIIVVAFASKFLGCAIPAKLTGFSLRESAAIGTLMSCKGLVELIVLNIGLSAGILNTRVFSMFVVMAVVTTCLTTPLTQLAYPVRLRKYINTESSDLKKVDDTDDVDPRGTFGSNSKMASKRYLVVLDRLDHLPGLLSLLQLLKPTNNTTLSNEQADQSSTLRNRSKEASGDRTASDIDADESSQNHSSNVHDLPVLLSSLRMFQPTSLDAVRIVELTERTSAVMRVAETEDTLRADPMVNVFKTFANLNKLPVKASMSVAPVDAFSSVIVNRAKQIDSDLIIVPWTLPTVGSPEPGISYSTFLNPMESFFGGGSQSSTAVARHQQAAFVRKIIQDSPCDVGLLLSNSGGDVTGSAAFYPHILLGFMGGPDDRYALSLALRMCRANNEVSVSVYRFRKTEAGEEVKSPQDTYQHTDTIRKASGMEAIQDTMYPHSSGFTPLQAQLEDDLAIRNVEDLLANKENSISSRFHITEVVTPTPLQDLITLVKKNGETSLIMLGRNRRLPTITHRNELRRILTPTVSDATSSSSEKETKLLNSETCTVIGEAGIAISRACTLKAPLLIIASALTSSTRAQDA